MIVEDGFHGDVPAPELLDILQSFLGILQLEIAAVMVMLEQQRAVVLVIGSRRP